ncbi:NAD(P)-binding protein [Ascodesmis nigricans]|uniref:NAD(P)-binding protein n=1 Tax=Ascodesmis nigricans TaxID=341454 RepID=A0A4S2N4N7_9PEZI|nr:NAD(P)-binding protein [Ascodesmis nigricans]
MATPPPWYHQFNLDLLTRVLHTTLLHPIIPFFLPLAFLALSHRPTSPPVVTSFFTAVLIFLYNNLSLYLSHPSGSARRFNPNTDVILITGGARGLGLLIASIYGIRGVSVAVLDILPPKDEYPGVLFIQCDITNLNALEKARKQVEEELGAVTVLISNAAVLDGRRIGEFNIPAVRRAMEVNLMAQYYLLDVFLPGIRESGGVVVTVGSVLGGLAAAGTALYAPPKAALKALHQVLAAEMGREGGRVKMVWVELGQMRTELFRGVETPNWFLAGEMEPVDVAKEVVRAVEEGVGGEVVLPLYARWVGLYTVLPVRVREWARWLSGIDVAMDEWGKKN